jgi:hypothetical protein
MNSPRAQILAILSFVSAAGLPGVWLLVRLRIFTFRDDYYGFNALGFLITWGLALIVTGALLGGLAWRADRRSWFARSAFGINGLLLAGLVWLLVRLGWVS